MTEQQAIDELKELDGDPEGSHSMADEILLQFLSDNGFKSIADEWETTCKRVGFWYA
jgi:hypothetical protein